MNILTKATVLVLNRNWQAINVRTPQEAFCMMATNVATGLEIEGEEHIHPVTWEEWITLPIRDQDEAVHTVRGQGLGLLRLLRRPSGGVPRVILPILPVVGMESQQTFFASLIRTYHSDAVLVTLAQ